MTDPETVTDTSPVPPRPAAPAARAACLVFIHPPGPRLGCRHPLAGGPVHIGRGDDCEVQVDDAFVSRRHTRLDPADGGHLVSDLGSTNGTRVNDQPVAGPPRLLRDGDYLRVGNCLYRYLAGGNVEAEYHEELYRLAVRDPLTRLPNRRALDEALDRETARARRHGRAVSVLLLDLDRFKAVNDLHGHLCGDAVLRGLADRLLAAARADDLCARYGGEEFALVLPETGHADAVAVAERVRAAVAESPFRAEGRTLRLTVSVGVATADAGAVLGPAELLRAADARLYRAKAGGRDRVVGADDEPAAPGGDPLSTVAVAGAPADRTIH